MDQTLEQAATIHAKVKELLKHLCNGLYEREEAVRLTLLSAIAGESIFLLGPPGVGKSLIARRLKYAFLDGVSFEYLMSKFSTPDEVFGPISIKKLKEEDRYERLTDRYLPGANIVFLDEIWKAGPAIQNALLTILNEKIYRNGEEDIEVDIHGIITASNELPAQHANLAPIWDRFLIRLEIKNIKKFGSFLNMITDVKDVYEDDIPKAFKISNQELEDWKGQINQITLGPEVLNTLQLVKVKIEEYNAQAEQLGAPILVNDRRWKKIVHLMRTSAFLNGRSKVDLMDCFLMNSCLWSKPEHQQRIRDILTESIAKHGYTLAVNLTNLKKEVKEFEEEVEKEIRIPHTLTQKKLIPVHDEYFRLVKQASKFRGVLIRIEDYRDLSMEELEVTNFFDEEKNLINRISASKGREENTLDVRYNSTLLTYELETRLIEKTEYISKKPHEIVQKFWNERYQRISTFISQQLENLSENRPSEIDSLEQNLFVDPEYADIVRSNYDDVVAHLKKLQMSLEKVQFTYTHV